MKRLVAILCALIICMSFTSCRVHPPRPPHHPPHHPERYEPPRHHKHHHKPPKPPKPPKHKHKPPRHHDDW